MKKIFNSSKFIFHRDAIISTLVTFILYALLHLIAFNTHYLNPITSALEDFEFSDLYFSRIQSGAPEMSKEIILFNVAESSREEIVKQIKRIRSYEPRVIGLDISFTQKKNSQIDSLLKQELHSEIPTVIAASVDGTERQGDNFSLRGNHPYFQVQDKEGYVNFYAKKHGTIRKWRPVIVNERNEIIQESFAVKIARNYSSRFKIPERWIREKNQELINYCNIQFLKIDSNDLFHDNPSLNAIKDKIVLVGYMGNEINSKVLNDLHYTPLKGSEEALPIPDHYGVEIHAFILNMLLHDRSITNAQDGSGELYILEVRPGFIWFIAFLTALLNMYLFIYFFVKRHILFHIVAKSVQLITSIVVFVLSVLMLHYRIKLEPAIIIIGIVLAADALYFVEYFMKRFFKSGTYFHNSHHT